MGASTTAFVTWLGSLGAGTTATAATTTAATATTATAATTAASAATIAGTDAAAVSAIAGAVPTLPGIAAGIGDLSVSDLAIGAGKLAIPTVAGKLFGGKRPLMPASPVQSQAQLDQEQQQAAQDSLKRQSIAGGINSTVGTSGGQGGSMLNPGNMGGKTLLGQ